MERVNPMTLLSNDPSRRLFVLVFVLSVGLGYSRGWSYLLAKEAGIPLVYIGLMDTAAIGVGLMLRYPIGVMIDLVGPRRFILLGCVFSAVASLLYLSRIGPTTFLVASALDSLSLLAIHASLFSTALTLLPEKQKGLFFSRYNIADQSGGVVLPIVAGFLARAFSIDLLFKIDFAASMAMLGIFFLLFAFPRHQLHPTPRSFFSKLVSFRSADKRIVALVLSIEFFLGASVGLFSAYLAVYAVTSLGMNYQVVGIMFCLSVLAFVVSSYQMGKVIDIWGPLKSWILSSVLYGVLLVALAYAGAIWVFIVIYCLTQVAQSVQVPAYQSLLSHILPKGHEGQITGLSGNVMRISTLLVAPLGAVIWTQYGPKMMFALAGALMCFSILPCYLFLFTRSRRQTAIEI